MLSITQPTYACNVPVMAEVEVDHNTRETFHSFRTEIVVCSFTSLLHNYTADDKYMYDK